MLAGFKELKNWVTGMWEPGVPSGEEDYRRMEYSVERHLHTPPTPSPLTYEQESRIKTVKFH